MQLASTSGTRCAFNTFWPLSYFRSQVLSETSFANPVGAFRNRDPLVFCTFVTTKIAHRRAVYLWLPTFEAKLVEQPRVIEAAQNCLGVPFASN